MFHKRQKAAKEIATHLIAAETAIDEALNRAASLAACMPNARIAADLAAEVGHEALAGVMQACQTLVEARAQMVETHRHLAGASESIGLSPRAFGPLPTKPRGADLHVVEAQAA